MTRSSDGTTISETDPQEDLALQVELDQIVDLAAHEQGSRIPFNKPSLEGRELLYMYRAVEGGHSASSGPFSKQVAEFLRAEIGAKAAFMTTSCTGALEMTALLMNLGPEDTVIVPSFTFVSTALAFARQGVKLAFADIEPETLGIDPDSVAELLDDSVRAVVPVHYAGVACDVDGLQRVLDGTGREITVVEDNAHGLFARHKDRPLGSFGRFSCLSFHETKNFVCGEGGALLVNDERDVARAHVLYEKGTNRQAFQMGLVDKYSWVDVGSSFGMSDILAAYLAAQLEARTQVLAKRRRVFDRYEQLLAPHAAEHGYTTPRIPADRDQSYHMFYVLLPDRETRDRVLKSMNEQDVQATFHYVPLHSAAGAKRFRVSKNECPVTDDISDRLLRLPFYNSLTDEQLVRVAETVLTTVGS